MSIEERPEAAVEEIAETVDGFAEIDPGASVSPEPTPAIRPKHLVAQ